MGRPAQFIIDKITKSIEERATGASFGTNIVLISIGEIKTVYKKDGWRFNWKKEFMEAGRHVYKLILEDDTKIQGLISLQPVENYIELHLIESAPHNYGNSKKYVGVPGNLVAFACKMSFDAGFEGFVAFTAKTRLIQHYVHTLGAELIFRDRMSISGISAKRLVNSYYKNYLDAK